MGVSTASFSFVAELMQRETSMLYGPGKEYLVEARLLPLAREAAATDVDAYVERIRTDSRERARAVDALTINETSWFRDNAPYEAFRSTVLPSLVQARMHRRHLRIWSAACSSGQEAYSIAMLLDEHLPAGWTAEILATDVSHAMVDRVAQGRYSQVEMNRGLPAPMLVKHFTREGRDWVISPRLRAMVRSRQMNLCTPFVGLPTFDLVLVRNVLIYFDVEVKRDVLRRMHQHVAPDGFLMLGSTETSLDLDPDSWQRELAGTVPLHRPQHGPQHSPTSSAPARSLAMSRGVS
ncbi:protein-glutamate O-methyltransferase CheR [Nocardioidaceae bacterium]|nr:protein-glutamate O-methyltransferase CheR [Nocardioidaceae bacterium]